MLYCCTVAVWRSGNGVWRTNEVTLRRSRLYSTVPGWVTVFAQAKHLIMGREMSTSQSAVIPYGWK